MGNERETVIFVLRLLVFVFTWLAVGMLAWGLLS